MARAPRRNTEIEDQNDDPTDEVMQTDRQAVAVELSDALESLRSIAGNNVEILVYKIGSGANAKWQHCKTLVPPINDGELLEELRTEWGGGDFALRLRENNKIKTTKFVSVAVPKSSLAGAPVRDDRRSDDLFMLMMTQQEKSSSNMMQMMMGFMQAQQAAAQNNTQMMTGLLTALLAKPAENPVATLAPLLEMMKPKSEGGLSETLDVLSKAKGLLGGGGESDGSLMGMIGEGVRTLGPVLGEALASRGQRVETVQVIPQGQPMPAQPSGPALEHTPAQGRFPILAKVAPDVLYFFQRQHAPDLAADAVGDILARDGVTIVSLAPIVAAFSQSANWLDDLAAEGIELRSNPVWAQSFLAALIAIFNDGTPGSDGASDDPTRGSGGAGNSAPDGAAS